MKTALTIFVFFVFCNQLIAQDEIYFRDLEDEPFKRSVEKSGITKSNDNIFLPSEKCEVIYMVNSKDHSNICTIELGDQNAIKKRLEI